MIMQIHVLPDPVGTAEDVYRNVDRAIAQVVASGLHHEVGAMGTTVEGPPDAIWELARRVHDAGRGTDTRRVMTLIKMYESPGSEPSMATLTEPFRTPAP